MSTADPSKILAGVPGRIAIRAGADFSSLSGGPSGFPFGGTELGVFRGALISRVESVYEVRAEEWGGEVVEEIKGAEDWLVTCLFRASDADVKRLLFAQVAVGAVTGEPVVQNQGGTATPIGPGEPLSKRWSGLRVLFMPKDTDNHDSVLIRTAIARMVRELEFPLALRQEANYSATFRALRTNSGNAGLRWGRLADL